MLTAALLSQFKERVYWDSGVGDKRKFIWLEGIDFPEQHVKGLIGFHAFTGKHYVQSFFRKGKLTCWKVMIECFANLVRHASESICTVLEKYV